MKPIIPWIIAAALVLHVLVWVAWFVVAGHHPVAAVPLAGAAGPAG